ncbi:MAG: thymidine phosphorylase [Rhodothermaceae bacterium]|nr:thymidine phosphorylase [Rhodothermaceae bacterium]
MNPVSLLIRKRDGECLAASEITDLVTAYTRGAVPDYQMAAFLMAAFIQGLNDTEAAALTRAMLHSGEVLDLSDLPGLKVDKHSTGGVGDKISLLLAPLVAACGVPVPMISGRGLGHSGGTLDKLEAIPGFNVNLSIPEYRAQLERIGVVMIGQTAEIAPADKKLYALRDVTGTVESIPLIAASIMSKKLAEGIDALVLDVKSGRGAFMKEEADARKLAETLVGIGREFDKPTVALLTDMNNPLGRSIGNWPETAEAICVLRGETPAGGPVDDVIDVTLALAAEMLHLGGVADSPDGGYVQARHALDSGHAFEKLIELVEAQGGDLAVLDAPSTRKGAQPVAEIRAPENAAGYVTAIDALALGWAAVHLGAGRAKKEDPVDPSAGFVLTTLVGDPVEPGDVLATVYAADPSRLDAEAVQAAFTYDSAPPAATSRLLDRYDGAQWTGF